MPDLSFEAAVAACAEQPELICLDGGPTGWKYLCVPTTSHWIKGLADVPEPQSGSGDTAASSWPGAIDGGWIIQCDYGLPVGQHAAKVQHGGSYVGRAARLDAWVSWDPQGNVRLHGSGQALAALRKLFGQLDLPNRPSFKVGELQSAWSGQEHMQKIEQLRAAIASGICFQGNLTVPFTAAWDDGNSPCADLQLFMRLRHLSPAPYAAFWRQPTEGGLKGRSICSHSPECYLQGDAQSLRSEPVKGTRARVPGREEAVTAELLKSDKDRAELAMIVDLVRNDLGRIAAVGSVQVASTPSLMHLDYVHHTYFRVDAQPRPETGIRDWLGATFPPGSITGAPKIEVMKLLQQLEGGERGPYCGCFGWLGRRSCALAVAIRTMFIAEGRVHFAAGGGIVADSQPQAEWDEVLAKASRMLAALH